MRQHGTSAANAAEANESATGDGVGGAGRLDGADRL